MDFKDYYATLGVAKTASEKEVKQAFRKLARKHHPDLNPGDKVAEAKFKDINEAYEVLGDPNSRKKYDELGANWRMYEQQARGGGQPFGGGAPFGQGGGARTQYRTMTPEEMEDVFGDSNPFSDFFTTFFGGDDAAGPASGRGTRGGRGRRRPGRDIENEIELGLEDAYQGATKRLLLRHNGQVKHVDVRIPAGVTDGSRVRVSGEGEQGLGGDKSGDL
ncbi:MAG TPA: DnaJ domain-containing protein, partial [Vicinamibacterales bacterium]|nr:DnaJ domain-containing protein [Vicinamibacterales bacterium]